MNYNNKRFRPIETSENGETDNETIFFYKQSDSILTASYTGGKIKKGHLLGIVDANGTIDMRYHQVNVQGELMTGICRSTPQIMPNGKIRLHEKWRWTSGDTSEGESILEEI
ncbi:n-acetylglutamate synthase [Maribacter sp. LLG6340-A2]|uniref:n-acetylglutamate synthase n=1 Tax=Maribacter sp. LLG6340-A2 TaxID=3160834 RepID=UPI00386F2D1A